MIDTHCHLTHPRFAGDRDEVVARARQAGLSRLVTIGTGIDDARAARALAARFPDLVSCSAGLDPFTCHALGAGFAPARSELADLLASGEFRAVGEIGLDYHYDLDPPALQAERLESQLGLAAELDLPVVIHVREAHDDMARVLGRHPANRGVIHSFTGGVAEAERYLDLGWMLSFNGVLTFRNAAAVREAAVLTPEDRLLVETDAPYLAPEPLRGKRCEPAHVAHTLERLAGLRGTSVATLASTTAANAMRLFSF